MRDEILQAIDTAHTLHSFRAMFGEDPQPIELIDAEWEGEQEGLTMEEEEFLSGFGFLGGC